MKIFANNFAVFLGMEPMHGHFRFEGRSRSEIEAWLRGGEFLFPTQTAVLYAGNSDVDSLSDWLKQLLQDEGIGRQYAQLSVLFRGEEDLRNCAGDLAGQFKPVTAAGGLVLGGSDALLAILRDGRWDLPKGKVEKGEDFAEAALREVAEETGLRNHAPSNKVCETFHVFPDRNGRWRLKTTHWFAMRCREGEALQPQLEEGITEVRWIPLSELRREIPVTYPQIMELMRMASAKGFSAT